LFGKRTYGTLLVLVLFLEVLDEEGFVAEFVVDEFVDGAGGEEEAVSAGAYAEFFAFGDVGGGVGVGILRGGVGDGFAAEAGSGVADTEDHGACGADGSDFDDLFGIEGGSVFHGVEEDLAECLHGLLPCVVGELGGELLGEGHETLGGEEAAVDADGDPTGAGGDDLDIVSELAFGCCAGGEAGDLVGVEWRGEEGEDAGAQGGDDFVGGAFVGEDDALDAGADGADLLEKCEAFVDGVVCAGDDDAEGLGAKLADGVDVSGGVFDGHGARCEGIADLSADRGLTSDD
jgi:hypothetical protein